MAITNLTGTTWTIRDDADWRAFAHIANIFFYFTFTSNGEEFVYCIYYNNQLRYYRKPEGSGYILATDPENWPTYKTLTITGNTNPWDHFVDNPELIAWFENNADQKLRYYSNASAFVATADAIRARGGTSAEIEWKANGFADAITNMVVPIPSDYGHISWDGHALTVS